MSTCNVLLEEFLYLLSNDSCQRLDVYPFSEIINSHYYKFYQPLARGKEPSMSIAYVVNGKGVVIACNSFEGSVWRRSNFLHS